MTAVVGILNKHAVAIAADSAVTIEGANGKKILNKANKVFTLSKYHPVGVMIYNSASFMSTPWETIIKSYRKEIGDKSFDTISNYAENFIEYLKKELFFCDEITQKHYLGQFIYEMITVSLNEVKNAEPKLFHSPTKEGLIKIEQLFEERIDQLIESFKSRKDRCPDFKSLSLKEFKTKSELILEDVVHNNLINYGFNISEKTKNKLYLATYHILITQEMPFGYTGLILTGFGDKEIYPSLIPLKISFAFDNRLRYYIDKSSEAHISNSVNAVVRPFAQTDVINTILSGIDPNLNHNYISNFGTLFDAYNKEIIKRIGTSNTSLVKEIESLNIDHFIQEYSDITAEIRRNLYITPLMNAVSTLEKEDLSEMAESLIYLTYLKRRITFAEESVGGPVDVAVISKGDGFIWIKRKHYFDAELNRHFFNNYFNH